MKPLAADTDPDVEARLVAAWRAMTPAEKFRAVSGLTRATGRWSRSGLRERHPTADEHELDMRLLVLRYGPDLVRAAYGWQP